MNLNSQNKESKLAINGGTPVRKTLLPYGRQSINQTDLDQVCRTLQSDWLTQGPEIEKFEKSVAQFVGVKYAVAYSSGTSALHGAYFAAGLKAGEEVLLAPITFAATGNAALYLGATPIFCDIEPDTGNIDVKTVEKKISKKTKILVGIDYSGQPCDADELGAIAKKHNLVFIVDAAHSLGGTYKGKPAGSLADMSILSFHPVKSMTTGEGGMVLTNDSKYYDRLLTFRSHGIEKRSDKLVNTDEYQGAWYHEMQDLGFNYRMTDIQAALGISQLKRLPDFITRRREIASEYRKRFGTIDGIELLAEKDFAESAYHLFPILITKEPLAQYRKLFFDALRAENIGVQVHYIPVYRHPFYQDKVSKSPSNCPESDRFYAREISLPIFPSMSSTDINDVVTALDKVSQGLLK
ncbi:UDP-4-amino-4,6-dideoxy-N-acetyl-beta-L-altrosamine transaminase [bacterium]|nr:UDP-4-amino-4,6-dideoxy-N-acetyl-beta-L-altrosamine transaminase [bacterium]QQR59932.1 MAG: UDP-4-amino-4,6-dideoxy-N-acetyl-beta-L-altrosamine transaminase [Candidatus Melainabacteria bacterium]